MRHLPALALLWCVACVSAPPSAADLDAIERLRFDAMVRQDVGTLEPLLGEDLTYCHSDGVCETKTQFLETIRSGRIRYRAIAILELRHRPLRDAAVLNGVIAVEALLGGAPRAQRLAFTDLYVRRAGRWQLIAWQSTRIP